MRPKRLEVELCEALGARKVSQRSCQEDAGNGRYIRSRKLVDLGGQDAAEGRRIDVVRLHIGA